MKCFLFLIFVLFGEGLQASDKETAQQGCFVKKAQNYLNTLKVWTAKFTQKQSDGTIVTGQIWVRRPGLLRLDYDAPLTSRMYIHDGWVVQHDVHLDETTHIPLNRTPAAFFLDEDIRLDSRVKIKGFHSDKENTYLKLIQVDDEGMGSIVLVFQNDPIALKAWYIVDEARNVTEVVLDKIIPKHDKTKEWFVYQTKIQELNHGR